MPPGKQASSEIVYTIYGVDMPPAGKPPGAEQAVNAVNDMDSAIKQAEVLFESGKYLSIEVKKKYAEEKTGRTIEMPLRRWEGKQKKDFGVALFLILAVLAGGAAFGLTLLVARFMG